jgi:cytochrome c biogenesis protein CcmG, thiol:disulfide interchange protein DsbE
MSRGPLPSLLLLALLLSIPSHAHARPAVGTTAPRFALPGRQGTVALDSLRGRVVLVDFWASWCAPCRASFPWLGEIQKRYGAGGLTVVGINLDKERGDAEAFLARFPAPFTVAFDPRGATAESFGVAAMPSSFLLDRTGKVILAHTGFDPRKTAPLEEAVRRALR